MYIDGMMQPVRLTRDQTVICESLTSSGPLCPRPPLLPIWPEGPAASLILGAPRAEGRGSAVALTCSVQQSIAGHGNQALYPGID